MRGKRAFSLALCCLLLLSGCGGDAAPAGAPPEDYAVGVLRTSGSVERSEILYFDAHLNQTGAFSLPYASVGDTFHAPVVFDGGVYFVPQGQANRRNQRLILRQDLETLDLRAYPLDQIAIYGLSATEEAVYAVSNLNGQSFVSRIDQADGTVTTAVFDGAYVSAVYAWGDALYVFSDRDGGPARRSTLHRLDPDTLTETGAADLSALGGGVYSAAGAGEKLYFAPVEGPDGGFAGSIGVYRPDTGELTAIELDQTAFHLLCDGERLYATHGNLVTGEGTALSVYDLETGERAVCDLGMWPAQIALSGGALYVMGADRVAKFDRHTLRKLAETVLPAEEGYYLSGIFARAAGGGPGAEIAAEN